MEHDPIDLSGLDIKMLVITIINKKNQQKVAKVKIICNNHSTIEYFEIFSKRTDIISNLFKRMVRDVANRRG